jgi:hypothetical protein
MPEEKAKLLLNVFDGTRRLISPDVNILITLFNGFQEQLERKHFHGPSIPFNVPFYNSNGDSYTVIAFANGHQQVGFQPVKVRKGLVTSVDLMLIPDQTRFNFDGASWDELGNTHRQVRDLLAAGVGNAGEAESRYNEVMDNRPAALACFFNVTTTMAQVPLASGTPLDHLKELIWGVPTFKQDRFFAYANKALLDEVEAAAAAGRFSRELLPSVFHPGATVSYKQKEFGEANLQLSFHTHDVKTIAGVECMKVEADIDYFESPVAHAILEVIPNHFRGPTDPVVAYVLRWVAGRQAHRPDFNPPYTIEAPAV